MTTAHVTRTRPQLYVVPAFGREYHVRPGKSAQRRPPVRLTRRGRALLRLFLVVMAALLVLAVTVQTQAAMEADSGRERGSLVVARGDTLWSIAARHTGGQRISTTVSEIAELNDLEGVRIEPGQRLLLP